MLIALLFALPAAAAGPLGTSDNPTAPSFTVKTLAGDELQLTDLLAEGPVLVDFWATWCKPCKKALPKLETLHQKYASRGLTVIGISADGPRNFNKVRPFVSRLGLTFPIAMDETGDLQKNFRVIGLPTSVLIDTTGAIVHTVQGFRPGEERRLAELIEALLPSAEEPGMSGGETSEEGNE